MIYLRNEKGHNAGMRELEKTRIAFYLDNRYIVGRNLKDIERGNPGVGGSQYMQLLVVNHLIKRYADMEIIMYITAEQDFSDGVSVCLVHDIEDALRCMKRDKCRVFILSNWFADLGDGIHKLQLIDKYRIRTIVWAHIFMNQKQYAFIASCKYIRLFVCLGKQQLEMLRGSKLYRKATYINYVLPPVHTIRQVHDEKIVVYVGALYSYKGFHVLAKYWKEIKRNVRDAQLWVVGNAQLYGDNITHGKYNIAEADYEKQFVHYLLNSKGEVDSSVKFFGSLGGEEKEQIVSQATVGIFNPCGKTETFGLSGVEFEAMGIPVVSVYKNSALDIIKDKETGLLFKQERYFPEYIIRLLNDKKYNALLGNQARAFVNKEFNNEKIIGEWYEAIVSIATDNQYLLKHDKRILTDNQIWLHHIDNFMREKTHMKKFIWDTKLVTGS